MKTIVILISGRGSNMQAIVEAKLPLNIAAVISNNVYAAGLGYAQSKGIATQAVDHRSYASRGAFDAALMQVIDSYSPDLVVLAGFMRIFTEGFVNHYQGRLMDIHPSLLPAFPGLNTHEQALKAGVKFHGCTVHLVTAQVDHGPIVAQAAVPVLADDTPASLATRVLGQEHQLYPQAIRWFVQDRLTITPDGRVNVRDPETLSAS